MKSGRRIKRQLLVILLLLGVLPPAVALAGHGVEDTIDTLPVEKVKQLMDAGEKLTFIDLRPAKEFQEKRIPGAGERSRIPEPPSHKRSPGFTL